MKSSTPGMLGAIIHTNKGQSNGYSPIVKYSTVKLRSDGCNQHRQFVNMVTLTLWSPGISVGRALDL